MKVTVYYTESASNLVRVLQDRKIIQLEEAVVIKRTEWEEVQAAAKSAGTLEIVEKQIGALK